MDHGNVMPHEDRLGGLWVPIILLAAVCWYGCLRWGLSERQAHYLPHTSIVCECRLQEK
jgi:hypothetical protein